jgi:ectoine hydroxylase-related dioxygenase (phytanoyl-CoA dioxygenase family)
MARTQYTDGIETLTDEEFRQYQQEGYLVVEDALSASEVDRVVDRLREYTHGDRDVPFETMLEPAVQEGEADVDSQGDAVRKFEGMSMVREDDVFHDLAHHESIVSVARDLLGPHLKLLRSAAMLKPPNVGSEKGLHQDAAYYPIRPRDHVTVWIALDDATPENGCMTVVPGAHMDGLIEHSTVDYDTDILIRDSPYDEDDFLELPMEAGDALFTHCLMPHRTAPNTTDSWRRAYINAYMTARSRFTQPPEERAPYVDSESITGASFPGCV